MAFRSQKRVEPFWYTPEDQEDLDEGEKPLRFRVRGLTATEQSDVLQALGAAGRGSTSTFRDCFRIGCLQIENAEKPNGKPCTSAASFLMLQDSFDYIIEVGSVIFDKSFVTEEEKKTSLSE